MDPNRIIQALKGTIDPNLRIAAENELNQVGEEAKAGSALLFQSRSGQRVVAAAVSPVLLSGLTKTLEMSC